MHVFFEPVLIDLRDDPRYFSQCILNLLTKGLPPEVCDYLSSSWQNQRPYFIVRIAAPNLQNGLEDALPVESGIPM